MGNVDGKAQMRHTTTIDTKNIAYKVATIDFKVCKSDAMDDMTYLGKRICMHPRVFLEAQSSKSETRKKTDQQNCTYLYKMLKNLGPVSV